MIARLLPLLCASVRSQTLHEAHEALSHASDDAAVHLRLGQLYAEAGHVSSAAVFYARAADLDPASSAHHYALIDALPAMAADKAEDHLQQLSLRCV